MSLLQKSFRNQRFLFAAALALQTLLVFRLLLFLPAVVQPPLVFVSLLLIPGVLTACIIYHKQSIPMWQVFGFGIGFGIGEALLVGRLLLTMGAGTPTLGYVLMATSVLKIARLWKQPFNFAEEKINIDWRLAALPVVMLGIIVITMLQINLGYPAHPVDTFVLNDKWSYLTVIQQFLTSPAHLNLRPEAIIFGTNTRLMWNSWLYFQAATSYFTNIPPVQLIFQYFRPGMLFIPFLTAYTLGYQIFRKRWLALLAATLHLLFAIGINLEGFWVWMRLEEDKYFAFASLMPLAWMFLLRALEDRRWPDLVGLATISMSLALVHPLGIPGLLLTGAPISVIEWWLNRNKGFSLRWLLMVLFGMGVFIAITLYDQKLVMATTYVQDYIDVHGALPSYSGVTVPMLLSPNARFIILALIPLGYFAIKDKVARFLFLVTAACVAVLCVPFVTSLVSVFTTSVGIDRYNWLIPYSIIATWAIVKALERLPSDEQQVRYSTVLSAAMVGVVVLIPAWNQWTNQQSAWLLRQEIDEPTVVSDPVWQGFTETAEAAAGKRAVTPTSLGYIAPTLWPKADLLIFNSPIHAPLYWPKIESLYQSEDIATTWMILDDLQPQILLVPKPNPLIQQFEENPQEVDVLYSNSEVAIFTINSPNEVRNKGDAFAFVAQQYTLKPGECTSLDWDTSGFSHLQLDGQAVAERDKQEVCPTENTVYRLSGEQKDGSIVTQTRHIFVSSEYDFTAQFDADQFVIQPGECVTIRWHVEGIDKVYFQGGGTVGESSAELCPSGDTLYTLKTILRNQVTIVRQITVYVRS